MGRVSEFLARHGVINTQVVVRPGQTGTSDQSTKEKKTAKIGDGKVDWSKYEIAYRRHPLIARAVDIRASLILGTGYDISGDPAAKACIENFIKKINGGAKEGAMFNFYLRQMCKDADVFGNSWVELLKDSDGKTYVGIKRVHPLNFDYKRTSDEKIEIDAWGNPVAGVWKKDSGEYTTNEIDLEPIVHHAHCFLGDQILGISFVEICYQTVQRLMNIEEGIAQSIYRHGFPLFDITVTPSPYERPGEDELSAAEEMVKGVNERSELVHTDRSVVKMIESQTSGNLKEYTRHYVDMICAMSGLPKWLIVSSGDNVSRAAAQEMAKLIPLTIEPMQMCLKATLESQMFRKVLDAAGVEGQATIEFRDIIPVDIYRTARGISMAANTIVDGKPIITHDQAKGMLRLPVTQPAIPIVQIPTGAPAYPAKLESRS